MDRNKYLFIVVPLIAALLFFGGAAFLYAKNRVEIAEKPNLPPIPEKETDSKVWGESYPRHYDSYMEATKESTVRTKYGGNDPFSKLEEFPQMKILFQGYGFGEEYNEERGHPFAVQDIGEISPARTKAGSVCLTCKSAEIPMLIEKYGENFAMQDFEELKKNEIKHSIGCSDCHDPKTMNLVITRPALRNALSEMGIDVNKADRQEMRTLVCAQCHVEYYFTKDKKIVTFPWGKNPDEMKPEKVYEYYQSGIYENDQFVDWVHPVSKTPMLKAQHPEYEFFQNSTHEAAGVSCSDCHMPYIRQGNVKMTSHNWASPLRTISESCQVCHRESEEYLKERVYHIQDNDFEMLKISEDLVVKAIQEIEKSIEANGDEVLIKEAQQYHRKAQWLWDWMSAENSMGFHNPGEALKYIGKSIDNAHKAIQAAQKAQGALPTQ